MFVDEILRKDGWDGFPSNIQVSLLQLVVANGYIGDRKCFTVITWGQVYTTDLLTLGPAALCSSHVKVH